MAWYDRTMGHCKTYLEIANQKSNSHDCCQELSSLLPALTILLGVG